MKDDQIDGTGLIGQPTKRPSQKGDGVNQDGDSDEDIPLAKFKQRKVAMQQCRVNLEWVIA